MPDREQKIRERAHQIWEQEGRPDGREQEHWERPSREVDAKEGSEGTPSGDAPPPTGTGSTGAPAA